MLAGKALERTFSHDPSLSALSLTQLSFSSEHPPNGTKHPPVTYTGLLLVHIDVQGVSADVVTARLVQNQTK